MKFVGSIPARPPESDSVKYVQRPIPQLSDRAREALKRADRASDEIWARGHYEFIGSTSRYDPKTGKYYPKK